MPDVPTATSLAALATQEFRAVSPAVAVGDEAIASLVENVGRRVGAVAAASAKSVADASRLRADDVMNPQGRDRLLAAIPSELVAATTDALEEADFAVDLIEGRHLEALLRHDLNHAATLILIEELKNHTTSLEKGDAAAQLASLAANVRYSTLLAGEYGDSLRARFGIRDEEFFRRIAIESLGVNGTPAQRRHAAALQEVPRLRHRVIGLARGSRDAAVDEIRQPRAKNPSEALR
jgi:hypothetical protein